MKTSTGLTYRKRISLVIGYMYQNLGKNLDVNTLADVAAMSPYHFHRIYREIAQETVNMTVRRLRLQHAAAELIRGNLSLVEIADSIAYSSVEAFTRAFVKQFGETPGEYRKQRQDINRATQPFVAMLPLPLKEYIPMYDVEISNIEAITLAGLEHQGDYMQIGQAFDKLFVEAATGGLLDDNTRSIGIYYHDPKSVAVEALRSAACISLTKPLAEGASTLKNFTIPAGRCATLLHKGSYAELEQPYDFLFGSWLAQSGEEAADFPPFEEYLNDPKTTPPSELLTKIHCLLV